VLTTYSGDVERPVGSAPLRTARDGRRRSEPTDALWRSLRPERRVLIVVGAGTDLTPESCFP